MIPGLIRGVIVPNMLKTDMMHTDMAGNYTPTTVSPLSGALNVAMPHGIDNGGYSGNA